MMPKHNSSCLAVMSAIAVPLLALFLNGCSNGDVASERASRAAKATGDIMVGVTWPFSTAKGTLWEGVELARDEINGAGGVMGRKISLLKEDDKLSVTTGISIAHKFADNPDVVAVIGTLNSYIAVATAPVYEFGGVVWVTPGSSVAKLTKQGYKDVFRIIPDNRDVGEDLADYAKSKNYKRVLVYYVKNDYGLDLANAFEQRASAIGVEVTDRLSYLAGSTDYRLAMQNWKDFYTFDAIFLAGSLPESAQIIKDARAIGIKVPIFAGDGLDSDELIKLGGAAVEGIEVVSFFHAGQPDQKVETFDAKYRKRYGRLPDTSAALGYDAMRLVARSMITAGTTVPANVSKELHATRAWPGVTGTFNFDAAGNVVKKPIVIQVVKNGRFEYQTILQ
jgi:branched-chain amino acid transport system substrate-binding protein